MAANARRIAGSRVRHLIAERPPAAWSLEGDDIIKPAIQGDYDGLCALYCIINAVRLVMAPHREFAHDEVRALFASGVRFLARRGSLPDAVHSCVRDRDWPKLAAQVVASAQSVAGRPILIQRPRLSDDLPIQEMLRRIEGMIISGKAPCVFLRGRYRHYSVISGYTPISLKLFDSFGYCRLRRLSCGTSAPPTARHRLHAQSILTLTT